MRRIEKDCVSMNMVIDMCIRMLNIVCNNDTEVYEDLITAVYWDDVINVMTGVAGASIAVGNLSIIWQERDSQERICIERDMTSDTLSILEVWHDMNDLREA